MTRAPRRFSLLCRLAGLTTVCVVACFGETALAQIRPGPIAAAQSVSLVVGAWLPEENKVAADSSVSPLVAPFGVELDSLNNLWIVELEGGRVHRLDPRGQLHQEAGNGRTGYAGDGQLASRAVFNGLHNLAITANNDVYLADSWNHCIRRIDAQSRTITTVAGTGQAGYGGDGGPAVRARFDYVMCITLDPSQTRLFIADLRNRRVRVLDLGSGQVDLVAGNGQAGVPADGASAIDSPLIDPRAVAVDSQRQVYILERSGHALRRVTAAGKIETVAGTGVAGFCDGPALRAQFNGPKHLCVDEHDNVYIADDLNARIRKYDPRNKTVTTILGEGSGDAQVRLSHPHGVTFVTKSPTRDAALFVVDTGHNRVLRLALE